MKTKLMIIAVFLWFTAIVQAVPARIDTLSVTRVRGYDISLSVAVPTATTQVTFIEVRMSLVNILAMNYATRTILTTIAIPSGTPAGTLIPLNVTNLSPTTFYFFAAKAKDTVWATSVSNVVAQATKTATATAIVSWSYSGSRADTIDFHYGNNQFMQNVLVFGPEVTQYTLNCNWGDELFAQVTIYNSAGSTTTNTAHVSF